MNRNLSFIFCTLLIVFGYDLSSFAQTYGNPEELLKVLKVEKQNEFSTGDTMRDPISERTYNRLGKQTRYKYRLSGDTREELIEYNKEHLKSTHSFYTNGSLDRVLYYIYHDDSCIVHEIEDLDTTIVYLRLYENAKINKTKDLLSGLTKKFEYHDDNEIVLTFDEQGVLKEEEKVIVNKKGQKLIHSYSSVDSSYVMKESFMYDLKDRLSIEHFQYWEDGDIKENKFFLYTFYSNGLLKEVLTFSNENGIQTQSFYQYQFR